VNGTINHGNTTKVSGSCNTAADVIEIKDVSNISILGVGTSAIFDQIGIHIRNSRNIIIRNVEVRNVKKSGTPTSNGGDAIGMETDVSNVWVDHVTLRASGGESQGYDGLFDMKSNTKYVTLSWSHLVGSERGGLVGSGDSDNQNNFITYHHNHFQNLNSRVPLLRFATAHAFNNFYNGISETGANPRIGGRIRMDNNYFQNTNNPVGTFYTSDMGYWHLNGNILGSGVTWSPASSEMHPAGPSMTSTTSISIPYSYTLDAAANVPSIVQSGAGVGKITF
jgi:pectate lyase